MKTKAARLQAKKSKRGRPKKEGVLRTPSGQISRSKESKLHTRGLEERLALETATWKRRQDNPALTIHEARLQEHGLVIAKWRNDYERARRRNPEGLHENVFTQTHFETAISFLELYENYQAVIEAGRVRSSSDLNRAGGKDSRDPFDLDRERKHAAIERLYKDCRHAILQSGPLGMMAVETVVIENKDVVNLLPDLRCALNSLGKIFRMPRAA